jgi:RES domain-containing protein
VGQVAAVARDADRLSRCARPRQPELDRRFVVVGLGPYASLTPEAAMAETLAQNRYYGVPIEDAMPRTFVAIEVTLQTLLDLRSGDVRRRLQVSEDRILAVAWRAEVKAGRDPITQRLGRAAHAGPWEGVIVPSAAAPSDHNLLVFPDKLGAGSSMKVGSADKLR